MKRRELTDAQRQKIEDARAVLVQVGDALNRELSLHKAEHSVSDAVPATLMRRALEYAVSQGVMEATTATVWREVFPIDRDMPKGARTKIYTVWSGSALAAWYRDGAKHPNVAVGSHEVPITFDYMSTSFTLSSLEMMGASYAGVSVEAMKFAKVLEGFDNKIEDLMFIGEAAKNYIGLIDHTNITQANLTNGDWDAAATTAANIMQDVKDAITTIVDATNAARNFRGKKIYAMCSPVMYRIGTTTIANTYTNETVETVLLKTDPKFGGFIESPMHGTTDGGSDDYISFGPFDTDEAICVPISMDAERMPPDDRGMTIEQPFVTCVAGLHVKQPLWFLQGEGAKEA
jgi:hypothetical protein